MGILAYIVLVFLQVSLIGTTYTYVGNRVRVIDRSDSKLRSPNAMEKKRIHNIIQGIRNCPAEMNGSLGYIRQIASDDLVDLEDEILIDENLGELIKSGVYVFGETKGWPYPTIRLNPKTGLDCRTLTHEYIHWRIRYRNVIGAGSASMNSFHASIRGSGNGFEDDLAEELADEICSACGTK